MSSMYKKYIYIISATSNCDALYKDQMLYVGESPVDDQSLHVIDV